MLLVSSCERTELSGTECRWIAQFTMRRQDSFHFFFLWVLSSPFVAWKAVVVGICRLNLAKSNRPASFSWSMWSGGISEAHTKENYNKKWLPFIFHRWKEVKGVWDAAKERGRTNSAKSWIQFWHAEFPPFFSFLDPASLHIIKHLSFF